ncbi:MAG: Hpt domain-containing protein, partial [Oscillospiraceae bacterium]|nr:Hpt domain-containing protein [Oscillospiraceae bacterium]
TLAHRLAHTLKTNAGMIKKTNLQNAAAKIESLLNAGSLPMPELLNTLENELNMVLLELGPPPESMAEGLPNRSLDKEQVSALLEKLETMLENINPECANLVDDLRILPGTEKLVQYIEEYDFEAAAHELGAIKKELDA